MSGEHRELLDGHRAELLVRLTVITERLEEIRQVRSGTTDDDEHDPEGGTLSAEWSRAEGQREDVLHALSGLDAAVARLEEGNYGACASCGREIPIERLRLLPAATLCVPCATALGR